MTDLENVAKKLGIDEELNNEIGGWDNLKKFINISKLTFADVSSLQEEYDKYKDSAPNTAEEISDFAIGVRNIFLNIMTFLQNLVNPVKINYLPISEQDKKLAEKEQRLNEAKEYNKALVKGTEEQYIKLMQSLVAYAEQKRRQKQIDFYNNNKYYFILVPLI